MHEREGGWGGRGEWIRWSRGWLGSDADFLETSTYSLLLVLSFFLKKNIDNKTISTSFYLEPISII